MSCSLWPEVALSRESEMSRLTLFTPSRVRVFQVSLDAFGVWS